jgi:thiol-disulfide isomerase/thioredoxin
VWAEDPASPLKEAWEKYQKEMKERMAEAAKASPAIQKELESEIRELRVIELDKLFELAEKEPTSAPAFDVFSELMFQALDKEKSKKARDLVVKNHLNQPHVKKILLRLSTSTDDKDAQLLAGVAEKNPDKECQGLATFGLGMASRLKSKQAGGQAKEESKATAQKHFTTVKEKYADVKLKDDTLGKLADGQLLALKLADQLQVGKAVPDISGEDLDGKPFKLSDFQGKVTIVSFWATWCPPCMALVPHERELVERMKDKPFALVGVNGDDLTDQVRKIIADKQITWRSFKNNQKDLPLLSELWDIEGWPTIYVIDHKGVIREIWLGSPGDKKIDETVDKLVAEAVKDGKK